MIVALELISPRPRAAAPDLVRLWESEGNPEYASYNGFPLALAVFGNSSSSVLSALHRHFSSPDRLHRALCAFSAWRLNPNDTEAISILRRELTATDTEVHTRYALLSTFWQFGTSAEPFLPEIHALVAGSTNVDSQYQTLAAQAAWHVLNTAEPGNGVIKRLALEATKPEATSDAVNRFASAALQLAEVPGVREVVIPVLKSLSNYSDSGAAGFASNVLNRLRSP